MFSLRAFLVSNLARIRPEWLPFAEAASAEVPLSRLLRLSLFQVTVGMALVLLVGTLNRVMIVELNVPATIVAVMLALPLLFAPFRALIGHRSDGHRSALGLRRIPYIWKGTMLQFGGFAIMPFALLVLSGFGEAAEAPRWIGYASAALAFLLVGAGVHMVQTVGLALATDLVREEDQPNVVGLMYVMLLVGMIGAAFVFGALLEEYSPARLIQVIQGAAVVTIALNGAALWKQEARNRERAMRPPPVEPFGQAWARLMRASGATRLLTVIGLGTFGFAMADVLLEPYGGQVLAMSVAETTRLTAVLALGTLGGFAFASRYLSRGGCPVRMAWIGAAIGVPAFGAITLSVGPGSVWAFTAAVFAAGIGAGLFGHGTLTATMRAAPRGQIGLALGAWGAVQATAAGLAVASGGIARDLILALPGETAAHVPYVPVFAAEMLCLAVAVAVLHPLRRGAGRQARAAYVK
ncbi:PucC family protein [Pseudaestuariivita sp.]|uniref:PucC family protein n=1 Tax=Pseudaestuariivita sp. TaxID=2211669 RepID=UPI0040581595